jgi:hypothetical protein
VLAKVVMWRGWPQWVCVPVHSPLSRRLYYLRGFTQGVFRALLFVMGFYWIEVQRPTTTARRRHQQQEAEEEPAIMVQPHN